MSRVLKTNSRLSLIHVISAWTFIFFLFWRSVVSRARNRIPPVPPRRMQRSSSKLGQLCHSASSLGSLQRRTIASRPLESFGSHDAGLSERGELIGSLREVLDEASRARAKKDWTAIQKGGTAVLDRAANWAHVKSMRKRRVPPHGIPQESVKMILGVPQDPMFEDDIFDVELGDQMLSKGSFSEVRRLVHVTSTLLVCS